MKLYRKTAFIGGKWIEPQSERMLDLIDPSTGIKYGEILMAGKKEADDAIKAANEGKQLWWDLGYSGRKNIMHKLADLIEANKEEFAQIESQNQGMPMGYMHEDIDYLTSNIRDTVALSSQLTGTIYDNENSVKSYNAVYPLGVCVVISPWNFPLFVALQGIAPALAAGNSIIFKPSEVTPLSAIKLFELMEEAGFPAGVVNLVIGSGSEVGHCLTSSPDIDKVTFTGSTRTGASVLSDSVNGFNSVTLELGGKSPFVAFADSEFDLAVSDLVTGIMFNSGQICTGSSRLIVENSIKDQFVDAVAETFMKLKLGKGTDVDTDLGPMVNKVHFDSVMKYIEEGIKTGQKLVCGGKRTEFEKDSELNGGYFIDPTIFVDVDQDSKLWKEEIFGPVLVVRGFDTEEEAIALANETEYGLASGVYTEDAKKAERVANAIEAGVVWINCYYAGSAGSHLMGWKNSGIGYDGGLRGLRSYTKEKLINIKK